MKETALKIINDLKNYNELYIIGHNNIDCDSYFSSYLLYKVLKSFDINAHFCILDNYNFLEEDKQLINDFKIEDAIIVRSDEINNKTFILVDHNDPSQSINSISNIVLSIDHHIETNKVKNCYSIEYTSTGLFIFDLFKDIYNFNQELRDLIALTVMTDSCYLTTSRFKESDKIIFKSLNTSLDTNNIKKKYFRITDFNLDIDFNIKNNHKVYHVDDMEINRVIIKGYNEEKKYIKEYVKRSNQIFNNNLFIFNNFEDLETYVYFKGTILKTYDHIITSSMLITKDLINEIKDGDYV